MKSELYFLFFIFILLKPNRCKLNIGNISQPYMNLKTLSNHFGNTKFQSLCSHHCHFQQADVSSKQDLIAPQFNSCSAPNSSEIQLVTSWLKFRPFFFFLFARFLFSLGVASDKTKQLKNSKTGALMLGLNSLAIRTTSNDCCSWLTCVG